MTADAVRYHFSAELWEWDAKASWFFVTVPDDISDEIDEITSGATGGFGSVRVSVTVGETNWKTSLFPSKQAEAYVLPIKRPVRTAEGIEPGDRFELHIELVR